MAGSKDAGVPWTPMQRVLKSSSEEEADLKLGEHLFTLSLSGQLTVKGLRIEPDVPNRPEGWRLNLSMKVHIFLEHIHLPSLLTYRTLLACTPISRETLAAWN